MATRLSPRRPADTGDEDVQPVSYADELAIRWMRGMGLDPRDYSGLERVQIHRREVQAGSAPQGTSANPGGYGPEHDNPIPYRPTPESAARVERMRQSIERQLGGNEPYNGPGSRGWSRNPAAGRPENIYDPPERYANSPDEWTPNNDWQPDRTPEYYDREYGPWGSVIRSLEGGQDWGPYRRLEAMQRLEALGPDLVEQYGHGWDPTAGIEAGDYTGERDTRAPAPVHDPELDGPFAGLHEALRQSQADAWTPPSGPSPSDAMPLPFLEPRTDEERTNDQLMEADRARQAGVGRPPSASQRWGVTPPPLRMTTAAAEMPGPNTAMVGNNDEWGGEWRREWGDQPEGTQTPAQGGAMSGHGGWGDWNEEWGAYGGLTKKDRLEHFEQTYAGLLNQLRDTYGADVLGGKVEDFPRQGPGSAASAGKQLIRAVDMGLPQYPGDAGGPEGVHDYDAIRAVDDARAAWIKEHPELWPAQEFTDKEDRFPIDEGGVSGLLGGDEAERAWFGPWGQVTGRDFDQMPSRKPPVDPNTAMSSLPTGDTDMRPWWLRLLDTTSGGPAAHGPDVNFPPLGASPSGNVQPLYDWEDPETPGPNTAMSGTEPENAIDRFQRVMRERAANNPMHGPPAPPRDVGPAAQAHLGNAIRNERGLLDEEIARGGAPADPWDALLGSTNAAEGPIVPPNTNMAMGDGQVRSLDQYRQQRAQAQHPAGTGGWADLLDSQLGTGPSESAGGFQSLADIAKQMGLDPDAAVTSLDEWRNRGNVGEQLPLFDPNSTMSGNGAVPRGLGGFRSQYRPQQLGGFQPARPMAPLGGFGRPRSLPPMGGYGSRGAGIPSSTNFSMQRHFNKPNHTPFDGMLENLAKNSGKIAAGTAIGIGAVAAGASRLFSPFGG